MLNNPHNSSLFFRSGSGNIVAGRDTSSPCQWTCSQRHDGEIEVRCHLALGALAELRAAAQAAADVPLGWSLEEHGLSFEGQTPDGGSLRLDTVDYVFAPDENELVFHVAQAVWEGNAAVPPSHQIFRLVNHAISSVPATSVTLPSGLVVEGSIVPLQLTTGPAWLRPLNNQDDLIKELIETGGVSVTTEFILPIPRREEESDACDMAHRLCCVLTLLSGNRVNWLSYSVIATDGSTLGMGAQNAVTRSYQKTDLINTLSNSSVWLHVTGSRCAPIINRMMARFESQQDKWNLTAIINSFHEAVSSGHFLEQQGQLLANCMEMLRQRFLHHGGNEFVLPVANFETKQKALLRGVKELLEKHFPAEEGWTLEQRKAHSAKLSQMSMHIKGANRYGFKHALEEMARELGLFSQSVCEAQEEKPDTRGFIAPLRLDSTTEELRAAALPQAATALIASLKAFVAIRDQLTHQGRFLVPVVDESAGWTSQKVNEERSKQERFMERFVAAYLTTILGWHQPLPTPPHLHQDQ